MKPYDYGEWLIKANDDGYATYERLTDDTPYQEEAVVLAQGIEILIGSIDQNIPFRQAVLRAVKSHSYSWYEAGK